MTAQIIEVEPLTDEERAEKYLKRVRTHLEQICMTINEAKRDGLILSYGTANNEHGEQVISSLKAMRFFELRH